jgi:transcriptional regulator with XRE-family HTH domain
MARKAAGFQQKDAAQELDITASAYSSYERGVRGITVTSVEKLDAFFGANKLLIRKWHDMNKASGLDPWFQQLSDLEVAARELRDYQPVVLPGLVQTEHYARALTCDVWPGKSTEFIDSLVQARMRRQALLSKANAPLVIMVIEESVVHRRVGDLSEEHFREQIARLIYEMERGSLLMQIIPRSAPRHHGGSGPFRINTFADRPSIASAEYMTGEAVIEDTEKVQHCMTVFGLLQGEALSVRQSLDMLREVLNGG